MSTRMSWNRMRSTVGERAATERRKWPRACSAKRATSRDAPVTDRERGHPTEHRPESAMATVRRSARGVSRSAESASGHHENLLPGRVRA